MIEADVETRGFQWYSKRQEMFLAQFLLPGEDAARIHKHPDDAGEIQRLLKQDDDYRGWNFKFDLHHFEAAGYELPPPERWHDGMVMAQLNDERQSVALEAVGERLFGPSVKDDERALKGFLEEETKRRRKVSKETGELLVRPNYSDVPDEIMYPYAGGDVELQREVMQIMEARFPDDLKDLYSLEMEVMGAVFEIEKRGINIDVEQAEMLEHELENDLDRLTEEAVKLAGVKTFNPRSTDQVAEALVRRGADLTFAEKKDNGMPSTNEETLSAIDDELAVKILELRNVQKLYGTNISRMLHPFEKKGIPHDPFIAPDGRIHTNYRQVGARHGRMSSADPNMQNWPRDDLRLRHLVIPSDGNILVASDLESVEMMLLAAFTGEGPLYEMALRGEDYHAHTANMIGLKDRERAGGVFESSRQRGKKFNYERIFGGGVRAIRRYHMVPQAKAREYLNLYREAYPEIVEFQERIEATLEDVGYVKTPYGRRQRVRDQRWVDKEAYKFVNYIISGTAADILKRAVVKVHKAGVPMVAMVHDEIVADVAPGDAEEVGQIMREALIDHPEITQHVPLDADAKLVERWSYAKDADFTPNYMRS